MISLPFRVACILIAGFLIVLAVTYIYKLNSRKVFWGVGLTAIIGILILLGLGVLRPSWGTETGTAVIVGISTAIGCAITLIYAAEDLHQKKRIKGKKITETESVQEDMVPDRHKVTLPSRLDTELARKIFDKAIEEEYIIITFDLSEMPFVSSAYFITSALSTRFSSMEAPHTEDWQKIYCLVIYCLYFPFFMSWYVGL